MMRFREQMIQDMILLRLSPNTQRSWGRSTAAFGLASPISPRN